MLQHSSFMSAAGMGTRYDNTTTVCPFLLAHPPQCDRTYAQNVGLPYDIFQILFDVVSPAVGLPPFVLPSAVPVGSLV